MKKYISIIESIIKMSEDIQEILNYRTVSNESIQENYTVQDALVELTNDDVMNNDDVLKSIETQIVVKNDAIHELQNNTDQMYRFIYAVVIGIFVIFILGIFTYVKSILQLSNNIYMLFVGIILFSYVLYIMYIYDFMYMKDSINKILNFIKYGKFEITPKINFNLLPKSVYNDILCKKRAAQRNPNVVSDEESKNLSSLSSTIKLNNYNNLPTGEESTYYYNDGDAPKLLMYPTRPPSTQYGDIVYPDSNRNHVDKTYRL